MAASTLADVQRSRILSTWSGEWQVTRDVKNQDKASVKNLKRNGFKAGSWDATFNRKPDICRGARSGDLQKRAHEGMCFEKAPPALGGQPIHQAMSLPAGFVVPGTPHARPIYFPINGNTLPLLQKQPCRRIGAKDHDSGGKAQMLRTTIGHYVNGQSKRKGTLITGAGLFGASWETSGPRADRWVDAHEPGARSPALAAAPALQLLGVRELAISGRPSSLDLPVALGLTFQIAQFSTPFLPRSAVWVGPGRAFAEYWRTLWPA